MKNKMPKREVWLDSVRGFAILIVLTVHIIQAVPQYHDAVSGCGKTGVWLLFLLTGFFTFRPYLVYDEKNKSTEKKSNNMKEATAGKKYISDALKFYLKRIMRIYPAFSVVLIICVFIGYLDVPEAVKNFLMIEGRGHFWTLPVEMKFYLVTPLIGSLLSVIRKKEHRGIFLCLVAVLFCFLFFYKNCPENSIQLGWYLPVLLFGALLNYVICKDKKNIKGVTESGRISVINSFTYDALAVLILLGLFLMVPGIRYVIFKIPVSRYLSDKYLYISVLWMMFLFFLDRSVHIRPYLEKSRILSFFGKISYSLYLVHYIVIQHLGLFIENQKLKSIIALIISLILAVVLEMAVERPVRTLSNHYFGK